MVAMAMLNGQVKIANNSGCIMWLQVEHANHSRRIHVGGGGRNWKGTESNERRQNVGKMVMGRASNHDEMKSDARYTDAGMHINDVNVHV